MKNYSFQVAFKKYVTSGVMLTIATICALVMANSSMRDTYNGFWNQTVSLSIGEFNLFNHNGVEMSVLSFINDFLMAFFFLSVGLEIKREILVGELSSRQKAILPFIAACGGMIIPVMIFSIVCWGDGQMMRGAAIPMATDIAFSLGVLSIFSSRVPPSLKIFLAALAVADDLGGIIVIATCYSMHIETEFILYAFITMLALIAGNIRGIRSKLFYLSLGLIMWYFILNSGIHATIAGVILAFCIPATLKTDTLSFAEQIRTYINQFPTECITKDNIKAEILTGKQMQILKRIETASDRVISPLQDMEDSLRNPVSYIVIPVFAFANAGITFQNIGMESFVSGVGLAVFLGLAVGKFIGVFTFSWLAIKLRLARKPVGCTWNAFASVCMLSGIGFTVALFISDLSFGGGNAGTATILNDAKIGIMAGSVISGIIGYVMLDKNLPHKKMYT